MTEIIKENGIEYIKMPRKYYKSQQHWWVIMVVCNTVLGAVIGAIFL
jgi:hypothetical protein